MEERSKQHKYAIRTLDEMNGLAVHSLECGVGFNWDEKKVLGWESNWKKRKIKESLWIQKNKPKLNLKDGFQLRGRWN